jgi:hypothetical protein
MGMAGLLAFTTTLFSAALLMWALQTWIPSQSTKRLDFYSSENIAISVAGHNEPRLVPFILKDGIARVILSQSKQLIAPGRVSDNQYYPDVSIPWEQVIEIGFYLEHINELTQESSGAAIPIEAAFLKLSDGRILASMTDPIRVKQGSLLNLKVDPDIAQTVDHSEETFIFQIESRTISQIGLSALPQVSAQSRPGTKSFPSGRLEGTFQLIRHNLSNGLEQYEVVFPSTAPIENSINTDETIDHNGRSGFFYPTGRLIVRDNTNPIRVRSLLAEVWQWNQGGIALQLSVFVATLGTGLGVFGLLISATPWKRGISLLLLLIGLGWPICIAQLPYLGMDEVRHTLSYLRAQGDVEAMMDLDASARRIHYERMHMQSDQRLSMHDLMTPDEFALHHGFLKSKEGRDFYVQDYTWRAPFIGHIWHILDGIIPNSSMESKVLGIRSWTFLLLAAGVSCLTIWTKMDSKITISCLTVILFWPSSIASWCVVGNYAYLQSLYFSLGLLLTFWISKDAPNLRSFFAFGLLAAMAFGSGLNAVPILFLCSFWLVNYLGMSSSTRIPTQMIPRLWIVLGLGVLPSVLWVTTPFLLGLFPAPWKTEPVSTNWIKAGYALAIVSTIGFGMATTLFLRMVYRCFVSKRTLARVIVGSALLLGIGGFLWSVLIGSVWVTDFEIPWRPTPAIGGGSAPKRSLTTVLNPQITLQRDEAAVEAGLAWITNLGPQVSDVLIFKGFFNQLGQFDTRIPAFSMVLVGFTLILGWCARGPFPFGGRTLPVSLWLLGLVCILLLSQVYWNRPLHGRYAAGVFYVFLLPWAAHGWMSLFDLSTQDQSNKLFSAPLKAWLPGVGLVMGILLQSATVLALLRRAFLIN